MSFFTNLFSGKTYTEMGNTIINEDGKSFVKVGSTWIGDQGEYIQRQGQHLVNLNTGTSDVWGDPFGAKNEH
jgi:hypothetical protein